MPILPCNGKNFLRGIVPDERRKPESKWKIKYNKE
jgi:hypothetical protein